MHNILISYQPVATLKPHPTNPRKHSRRQIKQIAQSVKTFGFNVPVIVNEQNVIIAGHGRVLAARELEMEEVPVVRLEHLSDAQTRAFMIADNKLTDNSTWDDRLLAEQLQVLANLDLDFNLEATGFTIGEIDLHIEGLTPQNDAINDLPPLQPGAAVTQFGDLWLLGDHRLLCGNALEEAGYTSLMAGKQATLVFTDPPYNVKIDGHVGGLGTIRHREFAMAAGEMSAAEFISFLNRTCALLANHSVDGSMHFICMDWRHLRELLEAASTNYTELKNICVWVKDNGGMGSLYRSQHEMVCVFKHGKAPHRNNVELGKYGRYRTNVWQYAGVNSFARKTEEGNLLAMHPTVKPVAMVADAILDCSARGEIVLDPFLGSGTTLMAAERTGRICYGTELDPLYVDAVIRRWQAYTGGQALHATTGLLFAEMEARHVG